MARHVTAYVLLLIFLLLGVGAQGQNQTIPAVLAEDPPKLDGDLSDACWQQASAVSDFKCNLDGLEASEPTTAWICYDQRKIYIAFACKDSQPSRIMAQQTKRGGDIESDDWVGFQLDCYRSTHRNVWFRVTAGGVQVEELQSGNVSKIEWKGDWRAAAKKVDDGYNVEIAVPFSILQYDAARTSMGIAFVRRHARTNREWWSPNVGPNTDPTYFYVWDGLKLRKPRPRPLLMAYSLLGMGEDDSPTTAGIDAKYAFTPNLTGLFALNPDFRNVEQTVDSVDFTYTERWLPDRRPFFEEGSKYFPTSSVFYSRRIGDIDSGGKLSGTVGDYSLGLMQASKSGESDYTVMQIGREWAGRGGLYLSGAQCDIPDRENTTARILGTYRFTQAGDRRVQLTTQLAVADTASGSGMGQLFSAKLVSQGGPRVLNWDINHQIIEPDYDPYLGYVPEKNLRAWRIGLRYNDKLSGGSVDRWSAVLWSDLVNHLDGTLYYNSLSLFLFCSWRNRTGAGLTLAGTHRPPYRDRETRVSYWWGERDLYRNGSLTFAFGKQAGGDYLYYAIEQRLRLSRRLSIEGSYEHSQVEPPSPKAYSAGRFITTMSYDFDPERTLAGRLISREGETNLYLVFRQRVRTGLDAYAIYGDPNAETTKDTFMLKLVRLL